MSIFSNNREIGRRYEVFRKPDQNDPNRAYVSFGGMIVTTLIFAACLLGALYVMDVIGFENPNPRYYETPK